MEDKKFQSALEKMRKAQEQAANIRLNIDQLKGLVHQFIRDNETYRLMGEVVQEGLDSRYLQDAKEFIADLDRAGRYFDETEKMIATLESNYIAAEE